MSCTTWETSIPNNYDRKLVMLNKSCEGIASSDVVSIELANARGDRGEDPTRAEKETEITRLRDRMQPAPR